MKQKTKPSFKEERLLWDQNINFVIGIDEVGRGAFAGPIVAGGVMFSKNIDPNIISEVNDSKLLKPAEREKCSEIIKENALFWTIEEIDINYINKHGIGKANAAVFRKVLLKLLSEINNTNYFILIDGLRHGNLPGGIGKQKCIIKGDQKSLSIAAASVIAKVHRDDLMRKAHSLYPNFSFSNNKGYGTKNHRLAIEEFGASAFHRLAFIN